MADQLELFPGPPRTGPRGFPLCEGCGRESIGPRARWCHACWTPERDPDGAALWDKIARELGLDPGGVR